MHCRQARSRLNALLSGETVDATAVDRHDPALKQHLAECPECARQWRAAGQLRALLDEASGEDTAPIKPLAAQRRLVEHRQAQSGLWTRWFRRQRHPRLALGAAAAVVVLALAALVPFADYRTVGYDLELDNVSEYLAGDQEQLCDLLYTLDLIDAAVDVSRCDTTCHVSVWDLKSPDEVKLVVRAVSYLSEHDVKSSVTPVVTRESRTLLDRAQQTLFEG